MVELSLTEIDRIVGGLPQSARADRTWWANTVVPTRVQAHAWLGAGYEVRTVDLNAARVTFVPGPVRSAATREPSTGVRRRQLRTAYRADMNPDEAAFNTAMLRIYEVAKREVGYNATRFLQMLSEHGGVATAKQLLQSPAVSDGFTALWMAGRDDLTVEAHVVKPEFAHLFTNEELATANRRLDQYKFRP